MARCHACDWLEVNQLVANIGLEARSKERREERKTDELNKGGRGEGGGGVFMSYMAVVLL